MESQPDLAGLRHAQKDEVIHALWELVDDGMGHHRPHCSRNASSTVA